MNSIAILILFFNKLNQTKECISSFIPSGKKIYVLNNGSDELQWNDLKKTFHGIEQIVFLDAGQNLGPSAGRNRLISQSKEEWLLIVDNDITIKQINDWPSIFNQVLSKIPEASVICPRIYNVHEQAYMDRLMLEKKENKLVITNGDFAICNYFPEGGSFVKREIFEKFGLYDEKMFAFEGYELSLRCMTIYNEELQVHNISEIELIHNHQFQKTGKDKEAVRERYNNEKIKASFDHLVKKYKISFEHEWEGWSKNQLKIMTIPFWKIKFNSILRRLKFR